MDANPVSVVTRDIVAVLDRLLRRRFFGKVTIEVQSGEVRNVRVEENHKPDQLVGVR